MKFAPAQHEMAPIFATAANISTDHNQLVMEIMKRLPKDITWNVMLHEKPFAGVNGSEQAYNNWSILTDTGINLLGQVKSHENNLFLLFAPTAVIKSSR